MKSISVSRVGFAASAFCGAVLLIAPATAQPAPAPAATHTDRNSPAFTTTVDMHVTVRPDLTAEIRNTVRYKVLREAAISRLGQQSLPYTESLNPLEVLEAFTEKADGRRIAIDPSLILTRDAATGLNAIYQRDAKVKTLVFPDVEVGDAVVYTSSVNRIDKRFPGHFNHQTVFARSVPYDTYRLTVDAPKSLALAVHVGGDGLVHEIVETDDDQRHVFDYHPNVRRLDEPGSISSWDRDPQLVITTFKDASELGASYWGSMKDRDVVSPEIQALADEITKGIDDKRAQAAAIDRWVKRNIRYVLVFLGSGGITPNPAPTVLKNKFGDCKDHVALMSALLKVKGIASEQVLINVGSTYRLPALPIPFFNHVMLYLPEFDLYTDPTASHAAFGILPDGSYDKPVLHISSAGGRAARTPPMLPDDHVTVARTIASVGADGVIKGTTRQTATGIFGTSARGRATMMQNQGREKFAELVLRGLGSPGTGVFEPATPSDLSEPYSLQGEFSLNEKLQLPLSGAREIPIGMPVHARPGAGLLGQRLADRQTDFICYAGKQVEETELTFAQGLPLPKPIRETAIDNKYFSYRASFTAKGRTLTIRREFTSKVAGQVCAKEIEAEISEPMQRVVRSLRVQMSF
jgi:transglutaminase-like putative cysteine protease